MSLLILFVGVDTPVVPPHRGKGGFRRVLKRVEEEREEQELEQPEPLAVIEARPLPDPPEIPVSGIVLAVDLDEEDEEEVLFLIQLLADLL